jgi:hypothetical protein
MSKTYLEVAEDLKNNDYEFEMNKYLSEGWEKGLPIIGWFVLFLLVSLGFPLFPE